MVCGYSIQGKIKYNVYVYNVACLLFAIYFCIYDAL